MKKTIGLFLALAVLSGCVSSNYQDRENGPSRSSGGGSGDFGGMGGPGGMGGGPGGGPGGMGGGPGGGQRQGFSQENGPRADQGGTGDYLYGLYPNFKKYVEALQPGVLTDRERSDLEVLAETIGYARTVDAFLAEDWGIQSFRTYARSEQTRAKFVKVLLDKYGLRERAKFGVLDGFTDGEIKKALADLPDKTAQGEVAALSVGGKTEELLVVQLEKVLAGAENADLRILCHNLYRAARFQLRSLAAQAEKLGGEYEPKYLPANLYRRILSSKVERYDLITDPKYYF